MNGLKQILWIGVLTAFILAACSSNQSVGTANGNHISEEPAPSSDDLANNSENAIKVGNGANGDVSGEETQGENGETSISPEEDIEAPDDQGLVEEDSEPLEGSNKPAWYSHEFTDAVTGEVFNILGFEEQVVLVEFLTFRCGGCLQQQEEVKELHSLLGERDDFESIVINIDPEEDFLIAAVYAEFHGFDWYYGDAPVEIVGDIGASLGSPFLDPSLSPMVLFDKSGTLHALPFGIKSAEDLFTIVERYLD
jgi:hypothetical protein